MRRWISNEVDEGIDVGEVGGDRERRRPESRLSPQPGLGDGETGERVSEVVHCSVGTAKTSEVRIQISDFRNKARRAGFGPGASEFRDQKSDV
jgi:hypothetical protein